MTPTRSPRAHAVGGRAQGAGQPARLPFLRLPPWLDVLLNVFAAPVLLSGLALHDLAYNSAAPDSWLLAAVTIWPLAWRRREPVAVFVVCLLGLLGLYATSSPPFAGFALLPALYTVAAHRAIRRALLASAALELLVVLEAIQQAPAGSIDDTIVVLSASAIAALFLGTTMRTQRRYLASLEDRARRLERERAQDAELAATAERTKIAREMHDIVAHGLSVVITMSEGAAARVLTDPGTAQKAMQQVAATGRQSLGEMRRLLGVLRAADDGSRAPQPGMADIDGLLDDVRATGLAVRYEQSGDLADLEPTLQAALFRAVQEGLTNVLKHAHSATVAEVRITRAPDAVTFSVRDDGRTSPTKPPAGIGLTGMAERAAIFDGTISTTAGPEGWTVEGRFEAVSVVDGVGADR